jgi:hypothetical protein
MKPGPSSVVATVGLHGSASTWVFNVVRELLIAAAGADNVVAVYAEKLSELPAAKAYAGRHLVVKSHYGSAKLDAWLLAAGPTMVLSVRDPRDAALSMAQRFGFPLADMAGWLAKDCDRLWPLADRGHPLLRYEERFFEERETVEELAVVLGLALPGEVIDGVFARYRTAAVRSFAEGLGRLPAARTVKLGYGLMDQVTQIHSPHIGDTASGKWRALPAAARDGMTGRFRPFLERFGYAV